MINKTDKKGLLFSSSLVLAIFLAIILGSFLVFGGFEAIFNAAQFFGNIPSLLWIFLGAFAFVWLVKGRRR